MKKRNDDVSADCPFYVGSDKFKISCEGVTEGNYIHMVFMKGTDRNSFKEECCDDSYKLCPVYQMLVSEYDKESH